MELTSSERQAFAGPLVVGCVHGALVALARWGFNSEYGHLDRWRWALDSLGAFLAALAMATTPLSILPIVVERMTRSPR
jgi:Mg/Co/Ni transporter MgtE